MGFQADHFRLNLFAELTVNIFKIGGFTPATRAIVNNLDLNDFLSEIYEAQGSLRCCDSYSRPFLNSGCLKLKSRKRQDSAVLLTCLVTGPEFFYSFNSFNNIESKEAQRDVFAEHGDQQQLIVNLGKMNITVGSLMKQQGKLLLSHKFCHGINCGKVTGSKGSKRVNIVF